MNRDKNYDEIHLIIQDLRTQLLNSPKGTNVIIKYKLLSSKEIGVKNYDEINEIVPRLRTSYHLEA